MADQTVLARLTPGGPASGGFPLSWTKLVRVTSDGLEATPLFLFLAEKWEALEKLLRDADLCCGNYCGGRPLEQWELDAGETQRLPICFEAESGGCIFHRREALLAEIDAANGALRDG